MNRVILPLVFFALLSACQGGGKLIVAQQDRHPYTSHGSLTDITAERAQLEQSDANTNTSEKTDIKNAATNNTTSPEPQSTRTDMALPAGYRDLTPVYEGEVQDIVTSEADVCSNPYGQRRSSQ